MRLTSLTLFLMTLTGLTIMSPHLTNRLTLKTCRAKRTQDLNLEHDAPDATAERRCWRS